MNTAGIDMGARTIKALVLRDGEVAGRAIKTAGLDAHKLAAEVMQQALEQAGLRRAEISTVVATGAGRDLVPDKDLVLSEEWAAARGVSSLYPEAQTVVDVGAEQGRAIRCDPRTGVEDFVVNEKCAAGAGAFAEAMARALEVPVEELGPLSLQSSGTLPMKAQCVVFAESELVSMIHNNTPRPDMVRAFHDAIAGRIVLMVHKVGCNPPVVLIGGMANNTGFVDCLRRKLDIESLDVPERPEFVSALGAALTAADTE